MSTGACSTLLHPSSVCVFVRVCVRLIVLCIRVCERTGEEIHPVAATSMFPLP